MLIKVNSRMWENFNCVNSLSLQRCIRGTGKDVYTCCKNQYSANL